VGGFVGSVSQRGLGVGQGPVLERAHAQPGVYAGSIGSMGGRRDAWTTLIEIDGWCVHCRVLPGRSGHSCPWCWSHRATFSLRPDHRHGRSALEEKTYEKRKGRRRGGRRPLGARRRTGMVRTLCWEREGVAPPKENTEWRGSVLGPASAKGVALPGRKARSGEVPCLGWETRRGSRCPGGKHGVERFRAWVGKREGGRAAREESTEWRGSVLGLGNAKGVAPPGRKARSGEVPCRGGGAKGVAPLMENAGE